MEEYRKAVAKAVQAADAALTDLLEERSRGGQLDTRALKEISASLKDLGGLVGGEERPDPLQICFEGFAEEASR